MRLEGGKTFRRAGLSGGEGTDTAGSVITAECSPCKSLVGRGACWATIFDAAGASAESPGHPLRVRQKPKRVRGWRWVKIPQAKTAIDGGDESRYTSDEFPQRSK